MTWGQFKTYLELKGVRDNDEIHYIDTYLGPDMTVEIESQPEQPEGQRRVTIWS